MMHRSIKYQTQRIAAVLVMLSLGGCAAPPAAPDKSATPPAVPAKPDSVVKTPGEAKSPPPVAETKSTAPRDSTAPAAPATPTASYRIAQWSELPGWRDDNVAEAWRTFLASCGPLKNREYWRDVCAAAGTLGQPSAEAVRRFFETHFAPYAVAASDAGEEGLLTGYYEPLLRGSRKRTARYRFPVYGIPDDLVVVELAEQYPELKGMRLRGRLEGRKLVPYPGRDQIDTGHSALQGKEIAWVDDEIDLFFLQIQGSGRIQLESGETLRVGYADQNGHPYRSIGRVLVQRGDLPLEQASMQGIKGWARNNPSRLKELLNTNASYVFFRELPGTGEGPPGSLGVPLTPRRSLAVDRRHIPLGAPVYIATTWPLSTKPLNRLMLAQDTGGAIRGPVRGDFFWGYGETAAREAGRMKQRVRMWLLLPHGHPLPADL